MPKYFASCALLPRGFARNVGIDVDCDGCIQAVATEQGLQAIPLRGIVVPGMPNLHSHAFQRAMAGLTERAGTADPSDFWTWRETMYRLLARLGPEDVEAVAAQLYVELIKAGYTAVAEFHYLHNDPLGRPYGNPAELAERIIAAADASGIGLTLLPVLYQSARFGGIPAEAAQRRFVLNTEAYIELVDALLSRSRDDPQMRIGVAPHSLRAVEIEPMREMVDAIQPTDAAAPIHIHVAEQQKEIDDCIAWCGQRPLEVLSANFDVDSRWCLVHCTQADDRELERVAQSGAVVGLCPTTEANLGDGLFRFPAFAAAGGRFGIGSDSNVTTSPAEELRLLEYSQRLVAHRRNVTPRGGGSTGAWLYAQALAGGAQACGRAIGAIAPGRRADLVVLDPEHPALAGRSGDALLDSWVFAAVGNPVRDVMIGGRWVVRDGRHQHEEAIADAYRRAVARLSPNT